MRPLCFPRSDVLPPLAIMKVGHVLTDKAKIYGKDNWRKIDRTDHLNHATAHIFGLTKGTHLFNLTQRNAWL